MQLTRPKFVVLLMVSCYDDSSSNESTLRIKMSQSQTGTRQGYDIVFKNSCAMQCFALPTFYKHRRMQFFPAWAYTVPGAILRIPFSLVDATIFTLIVYFPTGLAPTASRFFIFWGFFILSSQVGSYTSKSKIYMEMEGMQYHLIHQLCRQLA